MRRLTTEERHAQWLAGNFVDARGRPLTGSARDVAQQYFWKQIAPDAALSRATLDQYWIAGIFISKWAKPLRGGALMMAQQRAVRLRAELARAQMMTGGGESDGTADGRRA